MTRVFFTQRFWKQYFHCLKDFSVAFLLKSFTNTVDNHMNCLIKKLLVVFLNPKLFFSLVVWSHLFQWAFYLIPCNVEKHTFPISWAFYMTCVNCRVVDWLSLCIEVKTPNYIPKKKLKLYICVWTPMTWFQISESTFASKIPFHNSWRTSQLSKLLCSNVPLVTQRFEYGVLLPEFPGVLPALNLLKAHSFFTEYLIFVL